MEIHIGESTHHHDQSMTPQSFRTMKATVSNPVKPIPLLLLLDELLSPVYLLLILTGDYLLTWNYKALILFLSFKDKPDVPVIEE